MIATYIRPLHRKRRRHRQTAYTGSSPKVRFGPGLYSGYYAEELGVDPLGLGNPFVTYFKSLGSGAAAVHAWIYKGTVGASSEDVTDAQWGPAEELGSPEGMTTTVKNDHFELQIHTKVEADKISTDGNIQVHLAKADDGKVKVEAGKAGYSWSGDIEFFGNKTWWVYDVGGKGTADAAAAIVSVRSPCFDAGRKKIQFVFTFRQFAATAGVEGAAGLSSGVAVGYTKKFVISEKEAAILTKLPNSDKARKFYARYILGGKGTSWAFGLGEGKVKKDVLNKPVSYGVGTELVNATEMCCD